MAKQGKKETELAYVRWFDLSIVTGDPCQPEDLPGICENESAGVLVEEDESCITIALDRCIDTANVRLVLCVPKANVRSIQRFAIQDDGRLKHLR
jgi:hypothetical protein